MKKNISSLLFFIVFSVNLNNADDNIDKSNSENQELTELLNLLLQKDLVIKSMEGVFKETSRGFSGNKSNLSEKMLEKFEEKFNSQDVKKEISLSFQSNFSPEDISEMLKFYKTPVGIKAIEKIPEIMNESSQVIMKVVQDIMLEFMPLNDQEFRISELEEDITL